MTGGAPTFEEFLAGERRAILAAWEARAHLLPTARGSSRRSRPGHLPRRLDGILRAVCGDRPDRRREDLVIDGLEAGLELVRAVQEYALLRRVVHERWREATSARAVPHDGLRRFDAVIDEDIEAAVTRYVATRDRETRAIDRVSSSALSSGDAGELLARLLDALLDAVPAADTGAALLSNGGALRLCAAVGLEDAGPGFEVRWGEGFAGGIAATGEVRALREAPEDPQASADPLRAPGARALVGVPLKGADAVLGVVVLGTRHALAFPEPDVRLAVRLADRAATGVLLHRMRDQARRRAKQLHEVVGHRRELAALVESHVDLMAVIGTDRRVRYVNPAAAVHWGRPPAQVVGCSIDEVVDPRSPEGVHLRRALSGRTVRFEAESDGRVYEHVLVPVSDEADRLRAVATIGRDVTARTRRSVRERLQGDIGRVLAESMDLDRALQSVADLLVPAVADWVVLEFVEGARLRLAGLTHRDPARARKIRQLREALPPGVPERVELWTQLGGEGRELVREFSDDTLRGLARSEAQLAFLREEGIRSRIFVRLTARGRTFGALALIMSSSGRTYDESDLAWTRQLADRIGLGADNARLLREARDAARLREQILAVVSHDLRSPLSAIRLAAELLSRRGVPEPSRPQVETILRAAGRAEGLLHDLLDAASIRAGRLAITTRPEAAAPLLQEALADHLPLAQERGIDLVGDLDPHELVVRVDRARIQQVLGNLIGNALKFCRRGDRVTLRARRDGDELRVDVEDTGPGMSAEDLAHAFEAYWSGLHREAAGTGLGLAIARGIIEAHGGHCHVASEVGRGTTVGFTVPIERS